MTIKLALRNIKRSFSLFGVYFLTLAITSALLYCFNSISTQAVLFDLGQSSQKALEGIQSYLSAVSLILAVIVALIVLIANKLLIRRRSQEFGTYLLLGMKPRQVTMIVILETILTGILSFAVGILCGIGLSQVLSYVIGGIFSIPMAKYQFVFSSRACLDTAIAFLCVFIFAGIFNVLWVRKIKLINLLNADRKQEIQRTLPAWASIGLFVVAIGLIIASYIVLFHTEFTDINMQKFMTATLLMIAGTFTLSFAGAQAIVPLARLIPARYLRGIKPFTLRQISSRINTTFVSLAIVCLLSFLSFTMISVGGSMAVSLNTSLKLANPYDASVTTMVMSPQDFVKIDEGYIDENTDEGILNRINRLYPGLKKYVTNSAEIVVYSFQESTTIGDLMGEMNVSSDYFTEQTRLQRLSVATLDQFNAMRAVQGLNPISLNDNEYIINNTLMATKSIVNNIDEHRPEITAGGTKLSWGGKHSETALQDGVALMDTPTLIVTTNTLKHMNADIDYRQSYIGMSVTDQKALYEYAEDQTKKNDEQKPDTMSGSETPEASLTSEEVTYPEELPYISIITRDEMYSQQNMLMVLVAFIGLYLGMVLLALCAALLAIQQLSNTNDALKRYRMLSILGADNASITRSLITQISVAFLAPLVLALIHCWVATVNIGAVIVEVFAVDSTLTWAAVIGLVAGLVVLYLIYYAANIIACCSMVKHSLTHTS